MLLVNSIQRVGDSHLCMYMYDHELNMLLVNSIQRVGDSHLCMYMYINCMYMSVLIVYKG